MAETIIGAGGFIVPPPGYFEQAAAHRPQVRRPVHLRRSANRLGPHRRSHGSASSTGMSSPIMLVSAKGMGNGAPVGLTIATPEVADKYPGHHLRHVRRQPGLDGRGPGDAHT